MLLCRILGVPVFLAFRFSFCKAHVGITKIFQLLREVGAPETEFITIGRVSVDSFEYNVWPGEWSSAVLLSCAIGGFPIVWL